MGFVDAQGGAASPTGGQAKTGMVKSDIKTEQKEQKVSTRTMELISCWAAVRLFLSCRQAPAAQQRREGSTTDNTITKAIEDLANGREIPSSPARIIHNSILVDSRIAAAEAEDASDHTSFVSSPPAIDGDKDGEASHYDIDEWLHFVWTASVEPPWWCRQGTAAKIG